MKGKKRCSVAILLGNVLIFGAVLLQVNSRAVNAQSQTTAQTPGAAKSAQPDRLAAAKAGMTRKTYAYKLADGSTVKLDFPLFVHGQGPKVTKDVLRGYENFDSYCYGCHGQDVTGSPVAPDLRRSLIGGMGEQQFMKMVMAGKEDKGMPGWAGLISNEVMTQIYEYVKGRSLDLVPVGKPPSEMD